MFAQETYASGTRPELVQVSPLTLICGYYSRKLVSAARSRRVRDELQNPSRRVDVFHAPGWILQLVSNSSRSHPADTNPLLIVVV